MITLLLAGCLYNPFYFCKVSRNVSFLAESRHLSFSHFVSVELKVSRFPEVFKEPAFSFAVCLCGSSDSVCSVCNLLSCSSTLPLLLSSALSEGSV